MQLTQQPIEKVCPEVEVFESVLSLDNQTILELGCGDASLTRLIAEGGTSRSIIATEVDRIQHEKNLLIDDLPNVRFIFAGSENIPLDDESVDTVFMFKSLHHVPLEYLDDALEEVYRVLKPSGLAYISEPVYAGEFNEILRLFHDEQTVRQAAFEALERVVNSGKLVLKKELFFKAPVTFESFNQFSDRVIGVTHSNHQLSTSLREQVKTRFEETFARNGGHFQNPVRVDLLHKPG